MLRSDKLDNPATPDKEGVGLGYFTKDARPGLDMVVVVRGKD